MFTDIFIPYLLMTNYTYLKKEPGYLPIEYEFSFDYNLRLRELASSIQLTGKLICHAPVQYVAIRCFLQDVKSKQPILTLNESSIITIKYVEKDYKFSEPFWFDIFFNNTIGAEAIRIRDEYWNLVEADIQIKEKVIDLIISLTYLFKIDNNKIKKNLIMGYTSGFSVFTTTEMSTVGTCETKYNMTVTLNKINDDSSLVFQIIPSFLKEHFIKKKGMYRYAHVQIEKYVKSEDKKDRKCDNQSLREHFRGTHVKDGFMHEIDIVNSTYKMEIVNGKLNISNTINVRRSPDKLNPRTFVMDQSTSLNLTDIRHSHMFCDQPYFDWNHEWIKFSI